MHIYFQDFTFHSKHIIWSYNEDSKIAQCVYRITGEKHPVEPSLINSLLTGVPGIEIINGDAIIKNLETFRQQHPFNIVLPAEEPKILKFKTVKQLMFYRLDEELDQHLSSSSSASSSASNSPASSSSTPPPIPRRVQPITFKNILADFSGETLVYDADAELNLRANNDTNLIRLSALGVHSLNSVNLTIQVIKNIDYYILRQLQIKEAKALFEQDIIHAIYKFQNGAPTPKTVLDYFAHSVRNIMRNSKYNSKDTAFETTFHEENEPVPIESNYDLRAIYAREMLKPLLTLLTERPLLKNTNSELESWLIQFKDHLNLNAKKAMELELLFQDSPDLKKAQEELEQPYKDYLAAKKTQELERLYKDNPDAETAREFQNELEHRYQRNLEEEKALEQEFQDKDSLEAEQALELEIRFKSYLDTKKNQVLEYLYTETNNRRKILAMLEHLIVCTGLMDHDYKRLQFDSILQNGHLDFNLLVTEITKLNKGDTTLRYALEQLEPKYQLPTRIDTILPPVLYPLRTIIFSWLQMGLHQETKAKIKDKGVHELINDIMNSILPVFIDCTNGDIHSASAKHISHTIKSSDPDIYVNPEWKAKLEFKFIENTRSLAAHRKKSMKPEHWKTKIIEAIIGILEEQKQLKQEAFQEASQSSSTPITLGM
jgi:hypothetical protein